MKNETRLDRIEKVPEVRSAIALQQSERVQLALAGNFPVEDLTEEEWHLIWDTTPPESKALYDEFWAALTEDQFNNFAEVMLEELSPAAREIFERILADDKRRHGGVTS